MSGTLLLPFHCLICVPISPDLGLPRLGSFWAVQASEPPRFGETLALLSDFTHFLICSDHVFRRANKVGNVRGVGE